MTFEKSARILLFFLMVLTGVTPWTIDLPQVRKYLFEKHEKELQISEKEYKDYLNRDQIFYNNAQGNSFHNSKENDLHKDKEKYAEEFGYQSYMEKKVQDIVHEGSAYLEGLRRSLENFTKFVEDCNRRNTSMLQNPVNAPLNSSEVILNNTSSSFLFPKLNSTRMSCRQAGEVSERVRRYADLAMWATRRLQDLGYAENYQKIDKYEENELILKLAWFLDQLAILTGYEPDHKPYVPPATTEAPTISPTPFTLVPQTQEMTNSLINCMKAESSAPATRNCQYLLPLPDLVQQIVGGTSTPIPQTTSDVVSLPPSDNNPQQSMETLLGSEDFRNARRLSKRSPHTEEYYVPIPVHEKPKVVDFIVKKLSNLKEIVKTVKKHAIADFASQVAIHKHIHKRSIDDDTSVLPNQLSNMSKSIVESIGQTDKSIRQTDKSIRQTDKSIRQTDKSIEQTDKSIEQTDKSIEQTDKSIEQTDKSNEMTVKVPPIHLPILDVSIKNTKSLKKRSIYTDESIKERSIDNLSSNVQDENNQNHLYFDVKNNVAKISLLNKKNRHLLPVIKEKNIYKNLPKKEIIKSIKTVENKYKKLGKKSHKLSKRSLFYEHMYLPRIPVDPVGDISYYIKIKEGHMFTPRLTQAAQVRLGLQQVFQTGNIEFVRRYGSNYNPANQQHFYTGYFKAMVDS